MHIRRWMVAAFARTRQPLSGLSRAIESARRTIERAAASIPGLLLATAAITLICPPAAHAQHVLITAPQTINPGATTITPTAGGTPVNLATADITVRGTTLTINGRHNLASLRLENEAVTLRRAIVTHDANFTHDYSGGAGTDVVNGMWLILTGDVFIDTACEIDVTGKGFPSGQGPGAGLGVGLASGGGGYGGRGGDGFHVVEGNQAGGATYGSDVAPTHFGSGAGIGSTGCAGAGGGCVRIQTPASVIVDGFVRSDGQAPPCDSLPGGGGSGGSVWIQAGQVSGRGNVVASGGSLSDEGGIPPGTRYPGVGGGGRVRIECCLNALHAWNATRGGDSGIGFSGSYYTQSSGTGNAPGGGASAQAAAGTASVSQSVAGFVLRGDRHFCPGESLTLPAIPTASQAISVQWYKDGAPLQNSATITGANTNSVTFLNLQPSDSGLYEPRVQTSCGTFTEPGTRFTVGVPMITRLSTATTPVPFVDSAVAYDRNRQRLVLYGGLDANDIGTGQTWEFDGVAWTQRNVPGAGILCAATMVYDEHRGVCVLVGGRSQAGGGYWPSGTNAGIWEWDGSDAGWQFRWSFWGGSQWGHPAVGYDPDRRVTIIWGGFFDGDSTRLGVGNWADGPSMWEWDGANLASRSYSIDRAAYPTTAPPGMSGARFCYDRARHQMLLFGGMMDEGTSNILWAWNGTNWTRVSTEGPPRRWLHGMTYDEARRRTIVWSGRDRSRSHGDIWEWDGQRWSKVMGVATPLVGPAAAAVAYFPPDRTTYRFGGAASGQQSQITTYSPAAGFISGQPQPVSTCPGATASFSVDLAPQSGLTYQWRKGGVDIDTATNPSAATAVLSLSDVQAGDAGSYDCVVTSLCGSVTSDPATLTVLDPSDPACNVCPACAADYDQNGGVDGGDLGAFFADFEAGETCADVDQNGGVDGGDLGFFFTVFEAGGC